MGWASCWSIDVVKALIDEVSNTDWIYKPLVRTFLQFRTLKQKVYLIINCSSCIQPA